VGCWVGWSFSECGLELRCIVHNNLAATKPVNKLQAGMNWPMFGNHTNFRQLTLLLIGGLLCARAVTAIGLGLGIDESYAVAVARVPSFGFFDHPPLGFMLARWSSLLFGNEAPIVVRLPYLLLFTASSWALFRLSETLFNARSGFWAVALFSIAPFFYFSAGTWVVPDGPLIFFTLVATNILVKILFAKEPNLGWLTWLALGSAIGLALLSKYQAFLFGFGIFAFLITSVSGRKILATPGIYIAAIVAFLWFLPVVLWNAQHDWQSFAFQSSRATNNGGLSFLSGTWNLVLMIAGQLLYLLPGTFLLAIWALWQAGKAGPANEKHWLLLWLALPSVLIFNGLALFTENSLPHWPMLGYVFAFPLVGNLVDRTWRKSGLIIKRSFLAGLTFTITIQVLGLVHINTGILTQAFSPYPPKWDRTSFNLNWHGLRGVIAKSGQLHDDGIVVLAKSWAVAGKIDYALGGAVPVLVFGPNKRHFRYLRDHKKFLDREVIIISLVDIGEGENYWPGRFKGNEPIINVGNSQVCELTPMEPLIIHRGEAPHQQFLFLKGRFHNQCTTSQPY
jgi:hypothetical protein